MSNKWYDVRRTSNKEAFMVSTVALPPTDRIDPTVPVASPANRLASAPPVPDHSDSAVRPRPRFRRLVVFTGKLS